jgi:hypothetical protein
VDFCSDLFDGSNANPSGPIPQGTDLQMNTYTLLCAVRKIALGLCPAEVYALLLLDYVLIQIGGLATEHSQNRIFEREDLAHLYELLERWVLHLFPAMEAGGGSG